MSNDFFRLLKSQDQKSLEQQILSAGQSRYLPEGEHEVRISGVDYNFAKDNKITVQYADGQGREQNDMLYFTATNRKTGQPEIYWKLMRLLAAVLPSVEAVNALFAELKPDDYSALDLLIGLRLKIMLSRGKGYVINSVNGGGYAIVDNSTGEVLAQGNDIEGLKQLAAEKDWKKAYLNVTNWTATNGEANIETFTLSLKALHQPKASTSFPFGKLGNGSPFG